MKKRTNGFLSKENISHKSEIFDYIAELHNYLWRFVRVANPGASGILDFWVDKTIAQLEAAQSEQYCTCDVKPDDKTHLDIDPKCPVHGCAHA